MATLYGIRNCDTVKRARRWLEERGVSFTFHDFKSDGIDEAMLARWCDAHGWERVLNRAGTTFRKLPDDAKIDLTCQKAVALMLAQPAMIKRPVLEQGNTILVGFKPDEYEAAFG